MKLLVAAALALLFTAPLPAAPKPPGTQAGAQEQARVPKDSARIAIPGCAYDRAFIVEDPPNHEPVGTRLEPGRRFRLNGKKEILEDIRIREGMMIEVTGLVRKSDLDGPGGVRLFGGRVRIGGAQPQAPLSDARRNSTYSEVVLDVESWRMLTESCPAR
jgi:hypothetical protein